MPEGVRSSSKPSDFCGYSVMVARLHATQKVRIRFSVAALMETINLSDGAVLFYAKDFIKQPMADKLFAWLRDKVTWKQEMGGYGRPFPRLTAFYAEQGLPYRYSGVTHVGQGWTPILEEVKRRVDEVSNVTFNSLLLNYYRNGKDSIGWHADDERELGEDPVVASISMGAERTFEMKHKNGVKKGKFSTQLSHGSLLVMAGKTQTNWLHSVPKTDESVGERINLTFRKIW